MPEPWDLSKTVVVEWPHPSPGGRMKKNLSLAFDEEETVSAEKKTS